MGDFDVSEVYQLAADIGRVPATVVAESRVLIEKSAITIRDGMRAAARGIGHAPAFPQSITYDVRGLSAEIGPDKGRRQGALGNILYFGSSKNAPVIADVSAPLKRHAPQLEAELAAIVARALS